MTDEKRPRFAYRTEGTLDCWAYAGTLEEAREAIGHFLAADLPELAEGEVFTIEVRRTDMTDAEVEAMPDL